ncbi:MAG: hypothetical protein P8X91_09300, partial [Candidatus Bathyarchaeota archaeon]
GNVEWFQRYGEIFTSIISGESIVQTSDGGFAIGGYMFMGDDENVDFLLIKTDMNGNQQWNLTYGGLFRDGVSSIIETNDGGFALTGYSYSGPWMESQKDCLLIRTDEYGVIPELPSLVILPLILVGTLVSLLIKKKIDTKSYSA